MEQFLGLFQSLLIGTKFKLAHKKSDEPLHDYYNPIQNVFKGNSGLLSDVDSTQVALNSMFINRLNRDLSLLVKRTRMEWETMSPSDLVNLANQFSHTLDELPKRKTAIILNLQIQQMKAPKPKQNPPSFCCYCKKTGQWTRDCFTNLSTLVTFIPLTSLSNILPILKVF